MKNLNETFTDKEFKTLLKAKGSRTWHDVILEWAHQDLKESKRQ